MKARFCILLAAALPILTAAAPPASRQAAPDPQVLREMVASRPAFAALSAKDRQSMLVWIATRCAVGSDGLRAQLRQASGALDVAFAEAYLMGPSFVERLRLEQAWRTQYATFIDRVQGPDSGLFDAQTTAKLRAITEDDYAATALNQQAEAFRSAALDGLSLTASRRVLPWLQRMEPKIQDDETRGRVQRLIQAVQAGRLH